MICGIDLVSYLDYLRQLNVYSMMLRIVLALIMGGIIGYGREKKGRPAGFRTYMLVSMGAALTVILSQYLDAMLLGDWASQAEKFGIRTDASRFAAQVINGVGFLGAGTVIVTGRQEVKGLTTAAGLWASACMGIAIGAGFYECMIIAVVLIQFSLRLLPNIEEFIISRSRNMTINIEMDNFEYLGGIVNRMKSEGISFYDVEIEKVKEKGTHLSDFCVCFSARLPKKLGHAEVLAMLSTLDGVVAIDEG